MDEYVYKGNKYASLAELCTNLNLSYIRMWKLLNKKGFTLEEAIDFEWDRPIIKYGKRGRPANPNRKVKEKSTRNEVVVNGIKFHSLSEACRFYKINASTVTQRIYRGATIDEAFHFEKKKTKDKKKGNQISYKKKKYRSIKELCKKNKLEKHYSYIIKEMQNGRELSDILKSISNVPKKSDLYRFVIRGVEYESCLDFCRKNDLVAHYGAMRHDLRKGASPEAAFMHAIEIRSKKQ